ncbi:MULTISPECIES: hypothetical protein [unclassified Chelatococcus]|uniref:zinc finger domain-containing protein n=1 Tax=unclassified Chelatococcus TaxID=2638111 RepID=UPI001BD137B5|nr:MULTISPECIES: hypothetical protein [unclassified Chelatococcus]MBS7699162.1 hypothetical protein [Chelatococcus sp. YT9]MBX3554943.1 hypothetical protein [Chelatococcus sp.]
MDVQTMPPNEPPRIPRPQLNVAAEVLLLELAAKMSFSNPKAALDMIGEIPASPEFTFLRMSVIALIYTNSKSSLPREWEIRDKFCKNISQYLPGARRIQCALDKNHIPDLFIRFNDQEMPVEIKRHAFDERALQQLQRYMTVYGCNAGIAVAPRLRCALPANITFVQVDEGSHVP